MNFYQLSKVPQHLQKYFVPAEIGLEQSPQQYVEQMVAVFREVRRVLRKDGVVWLNLGDSYARSPSKGGSGPGGKNEERWGYGTANELRKNARSKEGEGSGFLSGVAASTASQARSRVKDQATKQASNRSGDLDGVVRINSGLANKQLLGMPWRVALALQASGWWLRQDVIWNKPNAMPDPVRDRCTRSHEYLFMLTKSGDKEIWKANDTGEWSNNPDLSQRLPDPDDPRETIPRWLGFDYYYDANAIKEPAVSDHQSGNGYKRSARMSYRNADGTARGNDDQWTGVGGMRNRRSVWTIPTQPYTGAHFATFPPDLVELCIMLIRLTPKPLMVGDE